MIGYRKSFDVVGYAFDADLHCSECTYKRFGDPSPVTDPGRYGWVTEGGIHLDENAIPDEPAPEDSEGNVITPVFLDQAYDDEANDGEGAPYYCGDCGKALTE